MRETQVWPLGQKDSPGEGNGCPLQYSCLENSTDRGAWWATVHGVKRVRDNWATNTGSFYIARTVRGVGWGALHLVIESAFWGPVAVGTTWEVGRNADTQFSSVQLLSYVWLFATLWIPARQASLSITNSQSSLRLTSIESVMPSSHLILCRPLFLLPPIPPSIRVFSNESTLCIRWPKYWSFSFSIIPSKEHPGLISFRMTGWIPLQSKPNQLYFSLKKEKKKNTAFAPKSADSNIFIIL